MPRANDGQSIASFDVSSYATMCAFREGCLRIRKWCVFEGSSVINIHFYDAVLGFTWSFKHVRDFWNIQNWMKSQSWMKNQNCVTTRWDRTKYTKLTVYIECSDARRARKIQNRRTRRTYWTNVRRIRNVRNRRTRLIRQTIKNTKIFDVYI